MRKIFKKNLTQWQFSAQVLQIVFSAHFDRFTSFLQLHEEKFKNLIFSGSSVHKYQKSCFWAHLTVLRLPTTVWSKTSKISYLREFSRAAQVSQIVSSVHKYHKVLAHLTVLRLLTTVWGKTSKISYLREFSAQVSQIVFWAHLTVLRLITTVWRKTSKISYLREFSAQVSQIVFLAHLTVLRLITTVWGKASKILYLNKFSAQVSQIVFWVHLTVLRLITTVWGKTSKISYLREFSAQVSQIVFWVHLTVLRLITTVWGKSSKIFLSPGVQCTSITNRVLSSFDRFRAYLQLYKEKLRKSHISASSVQRYNKSCSRLIWPFYGLFPTAWSKTSKISFLCEFSAQVSQMLFWAHLTVLRLITTIMRKNFTNLISPGFQCTSITNRVLRSF